MSSPYPWLRLYASMLADRRLLAAAADLGRAEAEVLGYLVALMLWAGEHAQDGIIRPTIAGGEVVIIERAVHWRGRSGRLAAALVEHGLLVDSAEGLMLADWQEQQGKHIEKLKRDRATAEAKRAAKKASDSLPTLARLPKDGRKTVARQSQDGRATVARDIEDKTETETETEEKKQQHVDPSPVTTPLALATPPVPKPDVSEQLQAAWNASAKRAGWQACTVLNKPRKSSALARLAEGKLDLAAVAKALEAAEGHAFLAGKNDRGWRASFDWLTSPKGWASIIEGAYAAPASRAVTEPVTPPCVGCGKPSAGHVWSAEHPACLDCQREAVQHSDGPRSWLNSLDSGPDTWDMSAQRHQGQAAGAS